VAREESRGGSRRRGARVGTTTRDFTTENAENAEHGRKQGNGTKTTGELDSKTQKSSPFSAFFAFSAVKK